MVLSLLDLAAGAGLIVIEAATGLFEGAASDGARGNGSSAGIAALCGILVVLALDVSGQSQPAAAAARGFHEFHPGSKSQASF
jgi:cobyrinic acid a,c-diamide synthase